MKTTAAHIETASTKSEGGVRTVIVSNGSNQKPDSLAALFKRLKAYALCLDMTYCTLARNCEFSHRENGRGVYRATTPIYADHPRTIRIVGNFVEISAAFCIDTDDIQLAWRLRKAIRANKHQFSGGKTSLAA